MHCVAVELESKVELTLVSFLHPTAFIFSMEVRVKPPHHLSQTSMASTAFESKQQFLYFD